MSKTIPKSIIKVQPSKQVQLETFGDEVDLDQLLLILRGTPTANVRESIVDGEIIRQIEGASYVTITVNDSDKEIQRSGRLGAEVDINVDGLWFRLAKVEKEGTDLTLTFEDREIAIMRTYKIQRTANRDKMTRAQFIRSLVGEVREERIPVEIPELTKKQPVAASNTLVTNASNKWNKYLTKDRGLPPHPARTGHGSVPPGEDPHGNDKTLFVKGLPMRQDQLDNAEIILDTGVGLGARRKVLVTAIMVAIQESSITNLKGGDGTSVGVYQIIDSNGSYKQRHDVEWSAGVWFFPRAIKIDAEHPDLSQNDLGQSVQNSGHPDAYGQWYDEANAIVAAYGIPATQQKADGENAQAFQEPVDDTGSFIFSTYTTVTKGGHQVKQTDDIWDATGRLADEVNWRRFMVSGTFYYASEPWLFKQKPRMTISEEDDGIDFIDYDYDVGKDDAVVTVSCRIPRWEAPPGSTVIINDNFVVDGRWLVSEVRRQLFSTGGTVTLKKPRPILKEPFSNQQTTSKWKFKGFPNSVPKEHTGDLVHPVQTPLPTVSQFKVLDLEGAPDRAGIRYHAALDWMGKNSGGDPVYAPEQGKIVEVKPSLSTSGQIFGGVVKIQTGTGRVWVFRHVVPILGLKEGGVVSAGSQVAAIVRWSDNPKSSHVHIEYWKTLAGGYRLENMIDPLRVFKGFQK